MKVPRRIDIFPIKLCRILLFCIFLSIGATTAFAQQGRSGLFIQEPKSGSAEPNNFKDTNAPTDEEPYNPNLGMGNNYNANSSRSRGGIPLIYQVHVLGEVRRPGTYRISPSMRVTDALDLAGGIEKNGSERFVELRRSGQKQGSELDLFAYKVLGDLSQNPYLQDNQTVFVPLKKRAVEIEGPIRRPGIYELKNENNLQDLIDLSGGFTVGVNEQKALKVIRYDTSGNKEIIDVPYSPGEFRRFVIIDGDVVIAPHKFLSQNTFDYNIKKLPNDNIFYPVYEDRVFVIGAVKNPGPFTFNQYYTLRQYLTLAGGTTTMAKNKQIKVVSIDGKSLKAKNGEFEGVVNPGDTIVVPEKAVPNIYYVNLLTTIASMGLSAVAIFR